MSSFFVTIFDENFDFSESEQPSSEYTGEYSFTMHDNIESCKDFILKQLNVGVNLENVKVIQGEKVDFKIDLSII